MSRSWLFLIKYLQQTSTKWEKNYAANENWIFSLVTKYIWRGTFLRHAYENNVIIADIYLSTLFAFSLLRSTVCPVVMYTRVLSILPNTNIPETRFTCESYFLHYQRYTVNVSDYFTRRASYTASMFLKQNFEKKKTIISLPASNFFI